MRVYKEKNVLDASKERVSWIFNSFKNVVVSVSGGKDSSLCFNLVHQEAKKRKRQFYCFWLDQEVEYQSSEDIVKSEMLKSKYVIPLWYQIPLKMRNATTNKKESLYLHAWSEEEKDKWMRPKSKFSIKKQIDGIDRFYKFLDWHTKQWDEHTCFVIGLRSEESLNRYRSVTKYPAVKNIPWTSKTKGKAINVYPIYDWTFEDIWKYFYDNNIEYNKVYDFMHVKKFSINEMRVSNLIHIQAFKCLKSLHEFEPRTYEKLLKRGISGIHTASLYSKETKIYTAKKLPDSFKSWKGYRDYLLSTQEDIEKWKKFCSMPENEYVYRQQVNAILKNDINLFINIKKENKTEEVKEKWKKIL